MDAWNISTLCLQKSFNKIFFGLNVYKNKPGCKIYLKNGGIL